MPTELKGQVRPTDVLRSAIHNARIATAERGAIALAQPTQRKKRLVSAKARMDAFWREERSETAKKVAAAWWG